MKLIDADKLIEFIQQLNGGYKESIPVVNLLETIDSGEFDPWVSVEDELPKDQKRCFAYSKVDDEYYVARYVARPIGWTTSGFAGILISHYIPIDSPKGE